MTRIENGMAIVEDENLGIRVICDIGGYGSAESMRPSRESIVFKYYEEIDAMVERGKEMLAKNAEIKLIED